jgi:hypothetical protein
MDKVRTMKFMNEKSTKIWNTLFIHTDFTYMCGRGTKRKNFFQSHTFLAVGRKLFLLATTSSGKKTLERKVKLALQ